MVASANNLGTGTHGKTDQLEQRKTALGMTRGLDINAADVVECLFHSLGRRHTYHVTG